MAGVPFSSRPHQSVHQLLRLQLTDVVHSTAMRLPGRLLWQTAVMWDRGVELAVAQAAESMPVLRPPSHVATRVVRPRVAGRAGLHSGDPGRFLALLQESCLVNLS